MIYFQQIQKLIHFKGEINMEEKRIEFTWNTIPLFTWVNWDSEDTDTMVFYECEFYCNHITSLINKMKKSVDSEEKREVTVTVTVKMDGWIQIAVFAEEDETPWTIDDCILYEGQIVDLSYVRGKLIDRFDEVGSEI